MSRSPHALHEAYDESAGIGGSSVAAALGLSKFTTRRQLYEKITGNVERTDNRFTYWGRMLEDAIAGAFTERTGIPLRRPNRTYRHPEFPFLRAHVDRLGYGFVFEAKTAGFHAGKLDWGETISLDDMTPEAWEGGGWQALVSDDIPDDYGLQLQHYMALTKRPHAFLVVLIGGNEAKLYHAAADAELYAESILPGLMNFWEEHVEKRVPPELVAEDEEFIRGRFPRAEDDLVISPTEFTEQAGVKLLVVKQDKSELEKREKHLRAIIEEAIGSHEGMIGGSFKVTWKSDPEKDETEWELVAKAYRGLLDDLKDGTTTGAELRALDLDVLESIHTNTKKGSRRFLISAIKGEQ